MSPPNLLIFMADHQRGDTVLPEHPALTPHLTRFAGEGVTFTNAFCPSPHCCPARATFWTGLYPSRHGVWNNCDNRMRLSYGLPEGMRLWSDDLYDAGYDLHFAGKWHIGVNRGPSDHGFRAWHVHGDRATDCDMPWLAYRDLAARPEDLERGEGEILRPGWGKYRMYGTRPESSRPLDTIVTEQAIELMPQLAQGERPWLMFVGGTAPHDPYFALQRHLDLYDLNDVPLPPSYHDDLSDKPRIYQRMRRQMWGQLTEREIREGIRHFWAQCTYLDELFGQLLAALDDSGQRDNTLVLYTSDHGDYCGDHGLFAKGIPAFRGAYQVPAIMRWPEGLRHPGRRVDEFVSLADFGPTFQEVSGGEPDRHLTGRSLAPFVRDEAPADWPDEAHTQCNGTELYYTQRSVTTREFKYVYNGFDEDELYDLSTDPDELRNVAGDSAYADVLRRMVRRMWRFACRENDAAINSYITVGLAPYGPAEAFRED
jgi:arylsulfatase A-like enzyme